MCLVPIPQNKLLSLLCSYFFLVEEEKAPMSMSINPCASAVDWQLSRSEWTKWADEETSGDQTGRLSNIPIIGRPNDHTIIIC